jgi:hypothetical protein
VPNDIKTDSALLRRLTTIRGVSRDQLRKQRVSFIYGALPEHSSITRQQIEQVLDQHDGKVA